MLSYMCENSKFISKRLEQHELCVSSVTQTSTEELVLNPLQSYEWRSNGKVNRPRRKINLENCLNSCRPVSLSLRDQTEGGDEMNVSLCLGGKCIAYTAASEGLLILSVFHQRLLLLLSAFLKGLSNNEQRRNVSNRWETLWRNLLSRLCRSSQWWRILSVLGSDLCCFPLNNSKVCSNVWFYPLTTWSSRSLVLSDGTWMQYAVIGRKWTDVAIIFSQDVHNPWMQLPVTVFLRLCFLQPFVAQQQPELDHCPLFCSDD